MKKRVFLTIATIITFITAIGFISTASAEWGAGRGHHRGAMRQGGGMGPGGCAYAAGNLSEEQLARLNEQRETFYKETEATRQALYAKRLELKAEIAKTDTDPQKAAALQKEISALRAELDQKRLDYMIKNKDVAPGFGRKGGMGYGRGMGNGPGAGAGYSGCPAYGNRW